MLEALRRTGSSFSNLIGEPLAQIPFTLLGEGAVDSEHHTTHTCKKIGVLNNAYVLINAYMLYLSHCFEFLVGYRLISRDFYSKP